MDISIVIVNWNTGKLLDEAVRSVEGELGRERGLTWEVVVVDNGSTDGSASNLTRRFRNLRLIQNPGNLGFARAANRGLAASSGNLILFLNPDVRVRPGAIIGCMHYLERDNRIGIVGCKLLNTDLTPQPSVENFHSVTRLLADNLALVPLLRPWVGERHRARLVSARAGDVDWLHGAFLLCRRSLLATIGGFDADYFMYGEDMDLCYRAWRAGYRVVYVEEFSVVHVGGASAARHFGARRSLEILRSTMIFFHKHRGLASTCAFRLLAGTKFAGRALLASMLALSGNREQHACQASVYWQMAGLCAGWERKEKR